jgi:hypothetical protein
VLIYFSLFQKDLYKEIMLAVLQGEDLKEDLKEEFGAEEGGRIRQRLHTVSSILPHPLSPIH